ncbi:MAG: DUF2935 domain-containing protein [Tuberibacillus sp.]
MANGDYVRAGTFELRFWLQVLGDHARFLQQALAAKETAEITEAKRYIERFDSLLEMARGPLDPRQIQQLSQEGHRAAHELRTYKLTIIEKQLTNQITIHFTASFISHMVNELEEFLRILEYLQDGSPPPKMHEVHHHLLWLQDAYGHSASLNSSLDFTEYEWLEKTDDFTRTFKELYLKAEEMAGFLRTDLDEFPALNRFNSEVDIKMAIFKEFLDELEELELKGEILDIISPLIADHMSREECYYLTKLAESRGLELPKCDPTKPRIESA